MAIGRPLIAKVLPSDSLSTLSGAEVSSPLNAWLGANVSRETVFNVSGQVARRRTTARNELAPRQHPKGAIVLQRTFKRIAPDAQAFWEAPHLPSQLKGPMMTVRDELVVVGDEVPGIIAAVYGARQGVSVTLVAPERARNGRLGGLLVRGNLAYLDRNQVFDHRSGTFVSSSYAYWELMKRMDVMVVGFDPVKADVVLRQMLNEASVKLVFSDADTVLSHGVVTVDATRSALYARRAGARFNEGFATLSRASGGTHTDMTLAVSPIFTLKGVGAEGWRALEVSLGSRPSYAGADYIDVETDTIGQAYHAWRGIPFDKTLQSAEFYFDRANIAILENGDLSVNALLMKTSVKGAIILADRPLMTEAAIKELKQIEAFFRAQGFSKAKVIPPEEFYVRHTGNIVTQEPVTLESLLRGGHGPYSFSYKLDIRGAHSDSGQPLELPENLQPRRVSWTSSAPIFRFGAEGTRVAGFDNMFVVGAAAGYTGLAPAVGRIEEMNIGKAELVSIESVRRIQNWRRTTSQPVGGKKADVWSWLRGQAKHQEVPLLGDFDCVSQA